MCNCKKKYATRKPFSPRPTARSNPYAVIQWDRRGVPVLVLLGEAYLMMQWHRTPPPPPMKRSTDREQYLPASRLRVITADGGREKVKFSVVSVCPRGVSHECTGAGKKETPPLSDARIRWEQPQTPSLGSEGQGPWSARPLLSCYSELSVSLNETLYNKYDTNKVGSPIFGIV